MAKDIIARYTWILDTIQRHGHISKERLNRLWIESQHSGGNPLADRTFYYYRRCIEQNFNIDILCNDRGEYYIDTPDSVQTRQLTNWMLNNTAAANALQELGLDSGRVEMEDVPSARQHLPLAAEAIRKNLKVEFTYAGFNRSRPEIGILFSPYFLKLYKQRWYMTGEKDDGGIRTYALDRVTEMTITDIPFKMPPGMAMDEIFGNIIGVTSSKGHIHTVRLQVTPKRAKYLRALPLHHSQTEEVHDFFSVFTYQLKLNYELVSEIMAMGPDVTVIAPRELQLMVVSRLRDTLANYK